MDSLLKRILGEEKDDGFAVWKAVDVDDQIIGTFLHREDYTSDADTYKKVVIKIDATEVVSEGQKLEPGIYRVWQTSVLKKAIERKRPAKGDRIGIRYEGQKKGAKLKRFTVIIEEVEGSIEPDRIWYSS